MAEEATSRATVDALLRDRTDDAVRRAAWETTGLVVLLGDPERTEAVWDDVLDTLPGQWRHLWRPAGPGPLLAGLRATPPPAPWTVVRLVDLRRFLMPDDAQLAAELTSTLRGVLRPSDRPLVVVATMPADVSVWRLLTQAPASGGSDRWSQARALLRGATVLMVTPAGASAGPGPAPTAAVLGRDPVVEPVVQSGIEPVVDPGIEPGMTVAPTLPGRWGWAGPPPVEQAPVEQAPVEPAEEPSPATEDAEVEVLGVLPARRPRSADGDQPVCARWRPAPAPELGSVEEPPEVLRDRALALEVEGNQEGAERLYELAAHSGDLVALARLAALRSGGTPRPSSDAAADLMYEAAAGEGNTAVLFGLAAAGHGRALWLLSRLKEEAGAEPPA